MIYDDTETEGPILKLYVRDPEKAEALNVLLPATKEFAGVTLRIEIIPGNVNDPLMLQQSRYQLNLQNVPSLFNTAFCGNSAYSRTVPVIGVMSNPIYYVIFNKTVVQYFTDDLGDANGVRSTLYQDMAKELFEPMSGVCYCTEVNQYPVAECGCPGIF